MYSQERRVKLEIGQQKELILNAAKQKGSLKKLGISLKVPYPTFKNYSQEYRLLPEKLFNKILKMSSIKKDKLNFSYLPYNWGMVKGGKKGMETLRKRYPKEIIIWRKKGIKNTKIMGHNVKKIKIPELDERLAEFIGVYLGDGTLTKYFIRISGDYRYDIPYFNYLKDLIYKLFGVNATITKDNKDNTMYLTIFSNKMCSFLRNKYGIEYGNKIRNKTKIPKQIMEDKKLSLDCIRGLIDTDGSISRRGRGGSQFCIQFTSHNKELLRQVHNLGKEAKIFTFGDNTGAGTNKWENITKYFKVIGSSNLRHVVRFNERLKGNTIYQKEVIDYYEKDLYKNIRLPFKIA